VLGWLLAPRRAGGPAAVAPWPLLIATTAGSAAVVAAPAPLALFGLFLKVGSVLFGSGYVLLAFLRAELVVRRPWLTDAQLLDAIAIGQVTPGPVFTTATFVGYLLAGLPGAVASTIGIFLPAFLFVALSGPLMQWLRRSQGRRAALDGLVAASLALMAAVVLELARGALGTGAAQAIAAVALVVLLTTRLNAALPLFAAGLLGWWLQLT
jgi:chromate transporter